MTFREFCESKGFGLTSGQERFIEAARIMAKEYGSLQFDPVKLRENGKEEVFKLYGQYCKTLEKK